MDSEKRERKQRNPRASANFLSALTFFYMFPVFKRSYKKGIKESDLFEPLKEHKSSLIGDKLERIWKQEHRKHKKSALHIALFKCFGLEFTLVGILKCLNEIMLVIVLPLSIGKLVQYFEAGQTSISEGEAYMYSGIIILCLCVDLIINHPTMMSLMHTSMKLRVSCSSLIYRKALRLSRSALGKTTAGQLVNLLSNDVSKFDQGFVLAHYLWIAPLQTAIGTYMLYREIGISAFIGITFLLIFIPAQVWLGKRTSVLRLRTALRTDERVRLMNEIISGIQVIKMYTWEKPFAKLISFARRKEINAIRAHSYLVGLIYSFETFVTRTCVFISIITFLQFGKQLTAERVFAITAIYNVLRPVITILFSIGISSIAEVNVSVLRIQNFLSSEEVPESETESPANVNNFNGDVKAAPNGNVIGELSGVNWASRVAVKNSLNGDAKRQMEGDAEEDAKRTTAASNSTDEENSKVSRLKLESNGAKDDDSKPKESELTPKDSVISLKEVSAKWAQESSDETLKDVSLDIGRGQLIAVVGPVGSGKTSLLNVLLRELPITRGTFVNNGTVSFSCQEPWLFSGSIRQNILFGKPYDEHAYREVLRACALEADLGALPHGDKTLVGEKGKTLSGGQKARINLARCVYKDADVYLLDDPLSAVDANVGKHLFEECVVKYLRGKVRILITHQLQYLRGADRILILNDGRVAGEGTYGELQRSGLNFAKLLKECQGEEDEAEKKKIRSRYASEMSVVDDDGADQELEKEQMESGTIKIGTYWKYWKSGGGYAMIFTFAASFLLCQLSANAGDYFITYWVNLEQKLAVRNRNSSANQTVTVSRENIIFTYSGITLALIFFSVFHCIFYFIFLMRASINLHDTTFEKISRATMKFFNANPSGRILNRFSKDLGCIDEYIPPIMFDVIEIGLLLMGTIMLSCIVDPWLLLPNFGLMILFYCLRSIYLETSRSVKRIEAITKSPLFGQMTASLQGLSTIRAFNAQNILIKEFDSYQDMHSSAWFLFIAANRAFGFWLDVICILFIAGVIFALLSFNKDLYGGDMGLIITQYIGLMGALQWGMRQWSELENQMTSVERLLEYSQVEREPDREGKLEKPLPETWPQNGQIEFRKVSLKYNEGDPCVLKGLSFKINPGEKVGICGRTGAGKSSLITALFQLYPTEGEILIDDVDVSKIPLESLRSKISIIPQEPVLFSGTIRKNLDPFDEYTDEVIWKALEQVELKDVVAELPSSLNSNVTEGGENFSVGQRQLFCLARAIIRNNNILVLDEATANVDPHTDILIQQTIRKQFSNCTVLTIAHRLHTVMDSDKILVMNAGVDVEFDHPHKLLQNKEGYLYKMVETTGRGTAKNLTNVAQKSYEEKKQK